MKPSTRDLLAYLDRVEPVLGQVSYFELLDVGVNASTDAIQRAYHQVAARMHPDRHRSELSPDQYERLNIVYGRITEAYRVLHNDKERAAYMRKLGSSMDATKTGDEAAALRLLGPKAQRLYRRAKAALRTGDRTSAILNLKMALRETPDSALLREALAELNKSK